MFLSMCRKCRYYVSYEGKTLVIKRLSYPQNLGYARAYESDSFELLEYSAKEASVGEEDTVDIFRT